MSTHNLCFEQKYEKKNLSENFQFFRDKIFSIQYNLNGSNPDGSFTLDDSKSFFSPYKILPIA